MKRNFSATKWNINTICLVFYLKLVHVQNVHLLPQYTPNNDVEQSDILSGLLLIKYHFWSRKIRWTLDFSIPTIREHCLNDFFGIVQKPAWLHMHFRYQWNFFLFRTYLSTHLAPSHQLQTCLGFLLLLPLLVMVYQIKPFNFVELEQHSHFVADN